MLEHATRSGNTLAPNSPRTLTLGENIVPRGSEARRGAQVVPAGTRIGPAEIALAATCGQHHLAVFAQPRVAILATGDELVELNEMPGPQQIRNSNSYAIAAMVSAAGGTPIRLPIARDLREDIHQRILAARSANLLILSGGVSMGEYDLVEEVLTTFGAEFLFTGVRMQPGKPVVFGRLPARGDAPELYFFGLPGNPISTQVTFHCFAELFLRTLAGEPNPARKWALATLTEPVQAKPNLTRLLPARLEGTSVTTTPWQGSGDLAANARANCYVEFKPNTAYAAGDTLRILLR
jgi:molybdopterin molybdotransferase